MKQNSRSVEAFDVQKPALEKQGFKINYKCIRVRNYWEMVVVNRNTKEFYIAEKHYRKLIDGVEAAIKFAHKWKSGQLKPEVIEKIQSYAHIFHARKVRHENRKVKRRRVETETGKNI